MGHIGRYNRRDCHWYVFLRRFLEFIEIDTGIKWANKIDTGTCIKLANKIDTGIKWANKIDTGIKWANKIDTGIKWAAAWENQQSG